MMKSSQRGVAMILALIILVVISVMAISLTFIARTETWSSMNYRLMSQARNAAEAGVNTTANYLMGSTFSPLPTNYYTPPTPTSATDPFSNYNWNAYPVQNGSGNNTANDVVLSASSTSSRYPINSVQSAFNTTGVGKDSFKAGNATVSYATSAKLLQMQSLGAVPPFTSSATTLQTWEITSTGSIAGVQTASEQVTAILSRSAMSAYAYAAFATSNGCDALKFGGGGATDSYSSGTAVAAGSTPATTAQDGNIGTNGNLDTVGSTTVINGNLSTPRIGVGTCSANNVTAWTNTSGNQLNGSQIELPQPVVYPTPSAPSPLPGTTNQTLNNQTCAASGVSANCSQVAAIPHNTGSNYTNNDIPAGYQLTGGAINTTTGVCTGTPTTFDNVTVNGNTALHLSAGCYNVNTLDLGGQGALVIDSGPVVLNVAGLDSSGQPLTGNTNVLKLTGGGVVSVAGWDPSMFQIVYAGSASITLSGGANAVGVMYAPNASYAFTGGVSWYGSVIGSKLTDMGGTDIHYDRRLKDKKYIPGPFMLSNFTWNKY